ncbi:RDD family protein [Amantichitinum ursilacus]|uniref:RDD family protein n=1 Tax=Amantichitinum ursilacus TaxID=857265 RepID=A0A0N1JST4_9NEIS|nr:RDD family protein [Amantichitinum ursilacus]KPC53066.1 RDD family protein [Amantichitinum ursilacus]
MLDPYYRITTPEGVELVLAPAGAPRRAQAWLLDFVVRSLVHAVIGVPVSMLLVGGTAVGVNLIIGFVIGWFYPVFFEVTRHGATPGKRWAGLQVVSFDGTPVTLRASVLRNVLRAADMLPLGYAAGLVSMFVDVRFRRLGDLAAGTLVVHRPPAVVQRSAPTEAPIPLTIALGSAEQRLLIDLAERAPRLPPQRVLELSDLALPLTRRRGAEGWARLQAHVAWLRGGRE